jgi:hypothetical protein
MTPSSQTPTGARERSDAAIEAAEAEPAPSHQGSAGGTMAREVGQRDEAKTAAGGDPLPTSVDGRDKPEDGDMPTRLQTRE